MRRDASTNAGSDRLWAQAFGALIIADRRFIRILGLSEAAAAHIGVRAEAALTGEAGDLLPRGAAHAIRNALGRSTATWMRERAGACDLPTGRFEIVVHVAGDAAVVELTPAAAPDDAEAGLTALARLGAGAEEEVVEVYLERAAVTLQEYCRAGRVAVLRRDAAGGATPVVDSRLFGAPELTWTPRAPAWTRCGVIGDAGAAPTPVIRAPEARTLDLDRALLAAPDSAALRELAAVGMAGVVCAPVRVEGRIWGHVAAQTATPRAPAASTISIIELAASLMGAEVARLERLTEAAAAPRDAALPGGASGLALVVEDDFLIAGDFASQLRMLGFPCVATAGDIDEARRIIAREKVAFCLLDFDLRGRLSTELALESAGTPYVFLKGHGAEVAALAAPTGRHVLHKPLDRGELRGAMADLLAASGEVRHD